MFKKYKSGTLDSLPFPCILTLLQSSVTRNAHKNVVLRLQFANRQLCLCSYTMHTFPNMLESEFNNKNNLLVCFLYCIYKWKYIFIRLSWQTSDFRVLNGLFSDESEKTLRVWSVTGYNKHLTIFISEIWWADCSTKCKLSIHFHGIWYENCTAGGILRC